MYFHDEQDSSFPRCGSKLLSHVSAQCRLTVWGLCHDCRVVPVMMLATMSLIQRLALVSLLAATALAVPPPTRIRQTPTLTERDDAVPTICGDIIDAVNLGYTVFFASDAYACLTSVPFNDAVAVRFIDYYNTTIQFQSTLAYLSNPPAGYQQPAVDVQEQLAAIKRNATSGVYTNEYVFEADLQSLVYRMHDAHVDLYSGILAAFSFASPYNLISASVDGKQLPQLFIEDDILALQMGANYEISPVVSINGEDAVGFVTRMAQLNSVGMLELHADWNTLMASPALDIQGEFNTLGGGLSFYPGDELNFTLANGTTIETWWLALYANPDYTGPLTTGGDFYNYFVLGLLPASYNETALPPAFNGSSSVFSSTTQNYTIPHNSSFAYPENPTVVQDNWSVSGGGVITAYFLNNISTAVISIPSFNEFNWDIGNFSSTVDDFIDKTQQAGLEHVIIDLQQNAGGLVELAFVTFRQFFPATTPFAGSRRRSHEMANLIGTAFTGEYIQQGVNDDDLPSEWVITDRLDADTGKNFSSWAEYYGPRTYNGDTFSLTERYDLSNVFFDETTFDDWIPTDYTNPPPSTPAAPFPTGNIVLLTDGTCSSACSLFVEMMTQAGVHTIVMGGRPVPGAMQAASGSRGAVAYSAAYLDYDITQAAALLANDATTAAAAAAAQLPNRDDTGVYINFAGLTLRDQVRPNDSVPLQFQYLPASCRLFYTVANAYNMDRLWRDVATAAWNDSSLCVAGSTGTGETTNLVLIPSQVATAQTPPLDLSITAPSTNASSRAGGDGPEDGEIFVPRNADIAPCDPNAPSCGAGTVCKPVSFGCGDAPKTVSRCVYLCVPQCNNKGWHCPASDKQKLPLSCGYDVSAKGTGGETAKSVFQVTGSKQIKKFTGMRAGVCVPGHGNTNLCSAETLEEFGCEVFKE